MIYRVNNTATIGYMMIFIILITDVINWWEQIKAGHDKKKIL